jgi:tryptophan-rich sensory protein
MLRLFTVKGRRDIFALIISIIISEGVGLLSAAYSMGMGDFYKELVKPAFAPPAWVFLPVWLILYLFMGIASYRIGLLGTGTRGVKSALFNYTIQLLLNFLWSIIFFRYRLVGIAFIEIVILLLFILITILKFFKLDKTAGLLMLPYLLWVGFAAVLNYSLWMLNM